jgi:hypothetical protein
MDAAASHVLSICDALVFTCRTCGYERRELTKDHKPAERLPPRMPDTITTGSWWWPW